jgi:N-acetylglucosamine repressor
MRNVKGSNSNSIKLNNRSLLINIVRKNRGISRAKLSEITGLSKGGITPIILSLIELGILKECGTLDTGSGRKPIGLEINSSRFYVVVIDFKRKDFTIGLVNFNGEVVYKDRYVFLMSDTLESILNRLYDSVRQLLLSYKDSRIIGIGVTAPGPLDYKNGVIVAPPNFSGWSNIPMKSLLEQEFNIPAYLDNNANAYAIAEKNYGGAQDFSNFLHLSVDEGIGAGVVINDKIYRGTGGFGNEIGHVTINMNGPNCSCGNCGCVELYASTLKIIEKIDNAIGIGAYSPYLSEVRKTKELIWSDIIHALSINDPLCINALQKEAEYLGHALVTAINMIEPQAVIIGSKLAECGDYIVDPLRNFLIKRTLTRTVQFPKIFVSQLEDGALIGGASMVIDHFIDGCMGDYEKVLE